MAAKQLFSCCYHVRYSFRRCSHLLSLVFHIGCSYLQCTVTTLTFFSFDFSFGKAIPRTPFLYGALIFAASTISGRAKLRRKDPYERSMR